jgi:glycosyltransferase involved in cell wall biosynthesis
MAKLRLSVVIPNYNHAKYLPEALHAILGQSFRPIEIIIIDDCSTDNSLEVIESFMGQESIIRLYRNEKNMGVNYSLNRGVSLCLGEYIICSGADDRVCPGLFEKSMTLLTQYPEAGLCSTLQQQIGPSGEVVCWTPTPVISSKAIFLTPKKVIDYLSSYGFWFTGPSVVYRRDAILNNTDGFLPELAHRSDHLVDYIVAAKHGACFIPEVLASYRILVSGYAETTFDNEALSRQTFARLLELMRSSKYAAIFPENFVSTLEYRGWFDLEVRSLRRLFQSQMDFIQRLKVLRPTPTLFDRFFFVLLNLFMRLGFLAAKVYLWHRRINWNFRWLAMKLKNRYSKFIHSVYLDRI